MMDALDSAIFAFLGADARISVATLARKVKVARSTIQARLERLEGSGIIAGYTVKLGEAGLGRLRAAAAGADAQAEQTAALVLSERGLS